MRIVFCLDQFRPGRGGAERYLRDLGAALSERGHEVAVAAASGESVAGIAAIGLAAPSRPRLLREIALAAAPGRFRRERSFDVVVAFRHAFACDLFQPHGGLHLESLRGSVRPASPRAAVQRLLLMRKLASPKNLLFLAADRVLLRGKRPPAVAALSRMSAASLSRWSGPGCEISVVPNGVDTRRFHPGLRGEFRVDVLRELKVPASSAVALFCGHNFVLKGLREALHGVAACAAAGLRLHLLVAGRGAAAGPERLARRLGLGDRVHLLGEVRDPRRLFGAADLLLHPTWYDPCSLVVLEALGAGVPVITTRFNGAAELMESGREGLVLEDPRDAGAMADAVAAVLGSERERFRAAAAARGTILDFRHHVDAFERICRRVQDHGGRS